MNTVEIQETFGAIFEMDQMCTGTASEPIAVGTALRLSRESGETVIVTVASVQVHTDKGGEQSDVLGIGLRGPGAHLVQAGDSLTIEAPEATAPTGSGEDE